MSYIIKMKGTRGYVSNIYKDKNGNMKVSYHKLMKNAKVWKTEDGVKKVLFKYIFESNTENSDDFMIIKKSIDYKEKTKEEPKIIIEVKEEIKKTKIDLIMEFFKNKIKYIKEEIKYIIKPW